MTTSRDHSRKPHDPSDSDLDALFEELATLERDAVEAAVEPVALTGPMFDIDETEEELLLMSEEEAEALALQELGGGPSRETQANVAVFTSGLTRLERLLREIDSEYDIRDPQAAEAMRLSAAAAPLVGLRDAFEVAVLAYRGGSLHAASLLAARLEACLKVVRARVARSGERELVVLLGEDVPRPVDLTGPGACFAWGAERAATVEARLARAWESLPATGWLVGPTDVQASRARIHGELLWLRALVTALSSLEGEEMDPVALEGWLRDLISSVSTRSFAADGAASARAMN